MEWLQQSLHTLRNVYPSGPYRAVPWRLVKCEVALMKSICSVKSLTACRRNDFRTYRNYSTFGAMMGIVLHTGETSTAINRNRIEKDLKRFDYFTKRLIGHQREIADLLARACFLVCGLDQHTCQLYACCFACARIHARCPFKNVRGITRVMRPYVVLTGLPTRYK